jgi:hypothetical protein
LSKIKRKEEDIMINFRFRDKHYAVFNSLIYGPCTFGEIHKRVKINSDELSVVLEELILRRYVITKECDYSGLYNLKPTKVLLYYVKKKGLRRLARHEKYYYYKDCIPEPFTPSDYVRKACVRKIKKILNRDNPKMKSELPMYSFWTINVSRQELKESYADLTIQCDLIGTDNRHVRYLKIQLDNGRSWAKFLARKMLTMTGTGIVLSPANWRIKDIIKAMSRVVDVEIKTDGVIFSRFIEFYAGGLLRTSFKTPEGTTLQFQPNCSVDS